MVLKNPFPAAAIRPVGPFQLSTQPATGSEIDEITGIEIILLENVSIRHTIIMIIFFKNNFISSANSVSVNQQENSLQN